MRRRVWETPKLLYVGSVAKAIGIGTGKISTLVGDPGEPRKVPSTG